MLRIDILAGCLLVACTSAIADAELRLPIDSGTAELLENRISQSADIDVLLARMTLDEKLGQLTQSQWSGETTGTSTNSAGIDEIRRGAVGSFMNLHGVEQTCALQRVAVEESRLGIPLAFAYDVIHGFRTIFPMPLAESASWNLEAIEKSARIAAIEATAHGVHWTFAPMVDIARDPRWGRIVEGAGEDVLLASAIAKARVRGFQGRDLARDDTMLATAKHFAAYGAAEGGRDYNVAEISERTLRETYLPPFRAALDAGAGAVMAAFNDIAGVPAHADHYLLTDILRNEWNFDGVLVSDYTGIRELIPHGVAGTPEEAGILALEAGVDIDMISGIYRNDLRDVVEPRASTERESALDPDAALEPDIVLDPETAVAPETAQGYEPASDAQRQRRRLLNRIDESVRRVLHAKARLGLFEDPYRYCKPERERRFSTPTDAHRTAARQMAIDSIVLLENRHSTLPLSSELERIAVIGPLADDAASMLGGWSMSGRANEVVTLLEALQSTVSPTTRLEHVPGVSVSGRDRSGFDAAVIAAERAQVVILVIGESADMSSEAKNRASIDLPGEQLALAQAVTATGTPVVVVLANGRPLAVPWLAEHVDALLETWFLGSEAGPAIADVLFGRAEPGGRLPVSIPRTSGQIPVYYDHRPTGRPAAVDTPYRTGYIDTPFTPLYPFGYGLGYTDFTYEVRIAEDTFRRSEPFRFDVTVTNTGARKGATVVQVYLRDPVAQVTQPVRRLVAFERVELPAGESENVRFVLDAADFAYRDRRGVRRLDPGDFLLYIGPSSAQGSEHRIVMRDD